jgi:hypothetical protein
VKRVNSLWIWLLKVSAPFCGWSRASSNAGGERGRLLTNILPTQLASYFAA